MTGIAVQASGAGTRCCPPSVGNKLYHSHRRWWERERERRTGEKRRQTGSRDLTTQCSQSFLQPQINKEQQCTPPPQTPFSYQPPPSLRHLPDRIRHRHISQLSSSEPDDELTDERVQISDEADTTCTFQLKLGDECGGPAP